MILGDIVVLETFLGILKYGLQKLNREANSIWKVQLHKFGIFDVRGGVVVILGDFVVLDTFLGFFSQIDS